MGRRREQPRSPLPLLQTLGPRLSVKAFNRESDLSHPHTPMHTMSRDTVLRRGGRKGSGGDEQGQQKEKFTSGSEANASADSGRKTRKDKREDFHDVYDFDEAFTRDLSFSVPDNA